MHVNSIHADDTFALEKSGGDEAASGVEAVLRCEACKELFVSIAGIASHIREAHADVYAGGRCGFCGMGFKSRASSVYHQKTVHPNEYQLLDEKKKAKACHCPECGKKFATR